MNRVITQFNNRQFPLFMMTGGFAACVNFGSRFAYNELVTFSNAIILAYCTGMITAYILARTFVFRDTRNTVYTSAAWFVAVNLVAAAQTWCVSMLLAYYVLPALSVHHFTKDIAHLAGVITPLFTSFLGHKHLSFR